MDSPVAPFGYLPEVFLRKQTLGVSMAVPVLDALSIDEFDSLYAKQGQPFILKSGPSFAFAECLKDFKELDPAPTCEIRKGNFADPAEYAGSRTTESISLDSYVRRLEQNPNGAPEELGYLGNQKVSFELFGKYISSKRLFFKRDTFQNPSMWLGPRGTITPLHMDGLDNFAYQISGIKKWTIASILNYSHLEMVVPFPEKAPNLHTSRLDLRSTETRKKLLKQGVLLTEFTLSAGEMLYLPAGWAHFVESLSDSLMFNLWLDREKTGPSIFSSNGDFLTRDGH